MVQQLKTFGAKSGDLGSFPGTHIIGGETTPLSCSQISLHVYIEMVAPTHVHKHTHTHNK